MATIIDETVILRYLLADNARESKIAAETIKEGNVLVYTSIMTRVCVVLRDVYHVPRSVIADALNKFLDDVYSPDKDVLRIGLRYFGSTTMDFTDCMMIARNVYMGHKIVSFDKPFMKKVLP